MKNVLFLLLCCFSMASTSLAQTTITTQMGFGSSNTAYVYGDGNTKHYDEYGSSVNISLALNRQVSHRFALGTEFGFQTFENSLDIKHAAKRINGKHERQQVYMALAPQYSLTKTPGLFCLNAGAALFIDVKNELNSSSGVTPMTVGQKLLTPGMFGGISIYPHFAKLGVRLEIRHTLQDVKRSFSEGPTSPKKFYLSYTTVFLGFSYRLD